MSTDVNPSGQSATMSGADLIAAERLRQVEAEGWTPEHDDAHSHGELVDAARAYCLATYFHEHGYPNPPTYWPWNAGWWKPSGDPIRNLVRAGALIAAEIDRLQREEARRG